MSERAVLFTCLMFFFAKYTKNEEKVTKFMSTLPSYSNKLSRRSKNVLSNLGNPQTDSILLMLLQPCVRLLKSCVILLKVKVTVANCRSGRLGR